MSSIDCSPAFDSLLELLASNADPDQVLGFRLPENSQRRLDELLAKNRANTLTDADRSELQSFEQLEHVVRLLKAKMYGRKNQ
ncbi:hypothetical protein N9Y42_00830 [Mariniblastus sp.]|nr:hypothetical protein [Mariniblastus sp.]